MSPEKSASEVNLEKYWFNQKQSSNTHLYAQVFAALPADLSSLGRHSLFALLRTTARVKNNYRGKRPSVVDKLWDKRENEWLMGAHRHLPRFSSGDLVELPLHMLGCETIPSLEFMEDYYKAVADKTDPKNLPQDPKTSILNDIEKSSAFLYGTGLLISASRAENALPLPQPPFQLLDKIYNSIGLWIDETNTPANASDFRKLDKDKRPSVLLDLLTGASLLEHKPSERLVHGLYEQTGNGLSQYSLSGLQEIIVAADKLWWPQPPFLNAYFSAVTANLDSAPLSDLSGIIYCLGKLNKNPDKIRLPSKLLNKFFSIDDEKLEAFSAQQLSDTLQGFFLLRIRPPNDFMDRFFTVAASKMNTFDAKDLSYMVHAAAKLSVVPSEAFFTSLHGYVQDNAKTLDQETLSNLLWAQGVFSSISPLPETAVNTASLLIEEAKTRPLKAYQYHRCAHACMRFAPEEAGYFPLMPKEDSKETTSGMERRFFRHLLNAKLKPKEGLKKIDRLETKTDFAFSVEGKRILVELDGPFHYVRNHPSNTTAYNGSTRLMTALICDAEAQRLNNEPPTVLIRMGQMEAAKLATHELKNLISQASKLDPGPHELVLRHGEIDFIPIPCEDKPSEKRQWTAGPIRGRPTKTSSAWVSTP